jgi:hypothetical protein
VCPAPINSYAFYYDIRLGVCISARWPYLSLHESYVLLRILIRSVFGSMHPPSESTSTRPLARTSRRFAGNFPLSFTVPSCTLSSENGELAPPGRCRGRVNVRAAGSSGDGLAASYAASRIA